MLKISNRLTEKKTKKWKEKRNATLERTIRVFNAGWLPNPRYTSIHPYRLACLTVGQTATSPHSTILAYYFSFCVRISLFKRRGGGLFTYEH